jgi:hypothetical protein
MSIQRIQCRCKCHEESTFKHTIPCCEDGYIEINVEDPENGKILDFGIDFGKGPERCEICNEELSKCYCD